MQISDILSKKDVEKCQKVAKRSDYLRKRAERCQAKRIEVRFCAFR